MKYKIKTVRNYDCKGIATWPKDNDRESRILSIIDSIMGYRHYVKEDGYKIVIEYGIGVARVFTRISAAINYVLEMTTMYNYSDSLERELQLEEDRVKYWPGLMSIWCLRTIEKHGSDEFGDNEKVYIEFDVEDKEWPYYDYAPGQICTISESRSVYAKKYHVCDKRLFNVSDIAFEKIDDNADETNESANVDNNESDNKENENEQV